MNVVDEQARGGATTATPGKTKVTVNFAADTYNALAAAADAWKISLAEALRRAVALLAFYQKVQENGDDLLVRNHKTQELDRIKIL